MFRLEALTRGASSHKVLHDAAHVGKMKVTMQPVPCALHALVAIIVDGGHNFLEQGRGGRYVETPVEEHHIVLDRPGRCPGTCADLVVDGDQGGVDSLSLTESVDEVEAWSRDRAEPAHAVLLSIPAREGISHHISCPGFVLHREVEAEQLANPMMLRYGGKSLVQKKLETVVISLDGEVVPPKIWPPVADCEHKANELSLVRGEGAVPGRHRPAEESDRMAILEEYGAEAKCRRVAFDDERLGEVGKSQDRSRGDRGLEGAERLLGRWAPGETILLQ